ncbi:MULTISPECIES: iron-sulfur cluster carrier protein ApbC [unclassified Moraxella]|uniref:iron-sulfur cluster carrier protein ApbC n=1 Tax=unclassified Moraxella TaxID=2685852 RepID=UPI002B40E59D|nr:MULTISPECIES: iron-sulfur cluster carrier protein ApbC [unclassified Moraxella]
MFKLFKKKKLTQAQIADALSEFRLCDKPLVEYLTSIELVDDVVNLSLKITKDTDRKQLESIYHALRTKLHILGIKEVNLNVVMTQSVAPTTKTLSKPSAQTFIPVNNANNTNNADNKEELPKSHSKQSDIAPHPRIRHIIAVASGKGGVGKSTTTVNVALALQKMGNKVGILDADIYGPSIPDMLGKVGVRPEIENDQFIPIDANGIAMLSIGSLIDSDSTPIAWRGVKATGALMQMYHQTNWPNLDYLIIDMPPGTGDITLTLAQRIPVTGAVIVTTPQHIALLDAKKGVEMFQKVHIPLLGIVENMALHICTQCGHIDHIFGADGGKNMAKMYGVPLLGQLPIDIQIREQMDNGTPTDIDTKIAHIYDDIAKNIETHIKQYARVRHDGRIF